MTVSNPAVQETRPYPPSWIDRLIDWLDSFRLPYLLVVILIYLFIVLVSHIIEWIYKGRPFGDLSYELFAYSLFTGEVLFFLKAIDRDAESALKQFRPLLDLSKDEFERLLFRLTTMPAKPVFVVTLMGIFFGIFMGFSTQVFLSGSLSFSIAVIWDVSGFLIADVLALLFVYRMIVQMRTVNQLYASTSEFDLFNLDPVYALSTHTAKISFILVFMVYSNLLLAPGSIRIPSNLITTIVISIIAFVAFLLPLRGVNRRLAAKKSETLAKVNDRIKKAFSRLENDFDNSKLGEMDALGRALSNLQTQKAYIEAIPTWPWRPAALRGFLSAMVLPIVIWLVQQILDRLLLL
jgi:hypothetical protein